MGSTEWVMDKIHKLINRWIDKLGLSMIDILLSFMGNLSILCTELKKV